MASATDIRVAVLTVLDAAGLVPVGHVHDTRTIQYQEDELPSVAVYATATKPESLSRTSQVYRATYRLDVEATVEADTDAALGALLDTYEVALLSAVLADMTWAESVNAESVEWVESKKGKTSDGNALRGAAVVSFEVTLAEAFEPSDLRPFERVAVTVPPPNGTAHTTPAGWEAEV